MSRTYRKNVRWYSKYQGEFCSSYNDKIVQGEARHYPTEVWSWSIGASSFFKIVKVADCDNIHRGPPKGYKAERNRIDRRRYLAALRKNEDAHIVSSFDPWDWD